MAKVRLANPYNAVELQYNPYQVAFMEARRLRMCATGHRWQVTDSPTAHTACPTCDLPATRPFRRFLVRAGRRGGKTRIGTLSLVEELTIPNVWWWASAPTYRDLEDFVMPAFFAQLPQRWLDDPRTHWSETDYRLILPNRAKLEFRSLEDAENARGPGLDGWYIDEICKITGHHWQVGRPMLTDRKGILIGTTTPRGEDWVDEQLAQPALAGRPGFWFCSYTTADNPIIEAEEIEEARETMNPLMFRQEYLADIVTFQGAIYGEILDRAVIDGTDEEMRAYFPEWPELDVSRPSITGLDPGTDHPFAGVHLVASPRGLVVVGEYEERQKPYLMHTQGIRQMQRGFYTGRVAIDRSQAQGQVELAQYGLFTVPAENDVVAGVNRVSAWILKNSLRPAPGELPSGLVLPRRLCPKLIAAMRKYRWADSDKRDGSVGRRELVYKKHDDLPDALRYALMVYPVLPTADPVAVSTRARDLTTLPPTVRTELERLRRHEQAGASEDDPEGYIEVADGVGDFYG